MTYPAAPMIETNYTAFQQAQGDNGFPGSQLDVDLANLRTAVTNWTAFQRLIQRADGRLANQSVGTDQLAPGLILGIEPPTGWLTGTAYAVGSTVYMMDGYYLAQVAHTSGTWETDLSSGYWTLLINFGPFITASTEAAIGTVIGDAAADAVDAAVTAKALIKHAADLTTIKAIPPEGSTVRLYDDVRSGLFVYDETITVAQHSADADELIYIAPDPDEDGAWVDPLADGRRSQWTDTGTPPGLFGRFRSGLRVGDSYAHRGALVDNTGTNCWLDEVGAETHEETWRYFEDTACIVATRSAGGIGVTGAVRVQSAQSGTPIGVVAGSYNNSTNVNAKGWALYAEAFSGEDSAGFNRSAEFAAINNSTDAMTEVTPYGAFPTKMMYCVGLKASGPEVSTGEIQSYFHFSGGGSGKAQQGFLFRQGSLKRESGSGTGYGRMFAIPANYGISQYGSTDNLEVGRFRMNMTEQATGQNIVLNDTGLAHQTRAGASLFVSNFLASPTSCIEVLASTSDAPIVKATGAAADIDLYLQAKGTNGRIRFNYASGSHVGFVEAQVTRILEVIDGAGNIIQLFGRIKP